MNNYFTFIDVASWNCDGAKGENGISPLHLNNQQPLTTFGNHHSHGQLVHGGLLGRSNVCDGRSSPPNPIKNSYLNSSQSVHAVSSSSHFQPNNIANPSQVNMTFSTSNDISAASSYVTSSVGMPMHDKLDRTMTLHPFPATGAGKTIFQSTITTQLCDNIEFFVPLISVNVLLFLQGEVPLPFIIRRMDNFIQMQIATTPVIILTRRMAMYRIAYLSSRSLQYPYQR